MSEDFKQILHSAGIEPQDLSLYKTALTHRSYLNESKDAKESNERMEFLGDAVLSFVISAYLYNLRPQDAEGDLTNLRAYLVKTESLAKISARLSLGKFLLLSRGEESSGGRDNHQLLANTYEAVIGAIFLDLGVDQAEKFIKQTLLPNFKEAIKLGPPRDPKSTLQEIVQSKFQTSPKYKVISTKGPDHAKKFQVGVFVDNTQLGIGEGFNKQHAEEEAAGVALGKLGEKERLSP